MPKFSYNRPITIEKYTGGTESSYNQETRNKDENWNTHWTGFCREAPSGSSEFFRSARLDSRITRVLKVRWNPIINAINSLDYRVQFEGKTQYLTGILDSAGDDKEIELDCTEFVDA